MWARILYAEPSMHAFVAEPAQLGELLADAYTGPEISRSLATCFPEAYNDKTEDTHSIREALAANGMVTVVVASGSGAPYKGCDAPQMCNVSSAAKRDGKPQRIRNASTIGTIYIIASVTFTKDHDGSDVAYLWNVCKNSAAARGLPYVTSALFQAIAMYIREARPRVVAMGLNVDTKSPTVTHAIKSYIRHGFQFSSKQPLGIPYYVSIVEPNRYKRMDLPL